MVTNPAVRYGTVLTKTSAHLKPVNVAKLSRRTYRQWRSSLRFGGSTLPIHRSPVLKVQVSSNSQRRHYLSLIKKRTHSRANFFHTCVTCDRLDDPPARLDNFSTPHRKITIYSWNIETFIVGTC